MTISKDILDIIVVLTPCIIAFYIIEALTHHKRIEYQRVILNIMVLNFIIYFLIYLLSIGYLSSFFNLENISLLSKETNISIMTLGLLFSILIGLIGSRIINEKYIFKIAKYFKVSDLTSNLNVWEDFISQKRNLVYLSVRDYENNKIYFGKIKLYSEFSHDTKELYLTDITVLNSQSGKKLYNLQEIYLVINDKMSIEIPTKRNNDE